MNQCVRPFRISINLSLVSYKVLLIPAGQDLKIKNKQKFNLQVYSKVHSTKLLTKYEKMYNSTGFSFIAGVIDIADKHSFTNIAVSFRKNLKRS
jgi:hypothetical protein